MTVSGIKKYYKLAVMGVASCFIFVGCESAPKEVEDAVATVAESVEEAGINVNELVTEEDYRSALAMLDSSDLAGKIELYNEFSNIYQLTEDEYLDFAAAYSEIGDANSQRDILHKLYRLDPSKEHGEMMSDVAYVISDADNGETIDILQSLADVLDAASAEDFTTKAITDIVGTDAWKESFYIDNGTFTSHTVYSGSAIDSDIMSDKIITKGKITRDGKLYSFDVSAAGCTIGVCELSENNPEGGFSVFEYDSDGNLTLKKSGNIKDGHCVGDLTVVLNGTEYKGTFGDDGLTSETQQEGLEGVVYAYDASETNYLYVEGKTAEEWKADLEFVGIE